MLLSDNLGRDSTIADFPFPIAHHEVLGVQQRRADQTNSNTSRERMSHSSVSNEQSLFRIPANLSVSVDRIKDNSGHPHERRQQEPHAIHGIAAVFPRMAPKHAMGEKL